MLARGGFRQFPFDFITFKALSDRFKAFSVAFRPRIGEMHAEMKSIEVYFSMSPAALPGPSLPDCDASEATGPYDRAQLGTGASSSPKGL